MSLLHLPLPLPVRPHKCLCLVGTAIAKCPQVSPGTHFLSASLGSSWATITPWQLLIIPGPPSTPDYPSSLIAPLPPTLLRPLPAFWLFYYSFASITQGPGRGTQKAGKQKWFRFATGWHPETCLNNWPSRDTEVSPFIPVLSNHWAEGGWAHICVCSPHGGPGKSEEIGNG